ncbi:MAG: hypothetical protein HRF49_08000, partial [bacterium]
MRVFENFAAAFAMLIVFLTLGVLLGCMAQGNVSDSFAFDESLLSDRPTAAPKIFEDAPLQGLLSLNCEHADGGTFPQASIFRINSELNPPVISKYYPDDSYVSAIPDDALESAIVQALSDLPGWTNFTQIPYYYYQSDLPILVFLIVSSDAPSFLFELDLNAENKKLNEEFNAPIQSARDYYAEQSYGSLLARFEFKKKVYTPDLEYGTFSFEKNYEINNIMFNPANRLSGRLARPVITFQYPESQMGIFARIDEIRDISKVEYEPVILGHVVLSIPDVWLDIIEAKGLSNWYTQEHLILQHELGHLLGWPDTYLIGSSGGYPGFGELDLMSFGTAPLGFFKAICGWTCLLNTKYDSMALFIRPQDTLEGCRELYLVKHNPSCPAELVYLEVQAGWGLTGFPSPGHEQPMAGNDNWGLIPVHIDLNRGFGDEKPPFWIDSYNWPDANWQYLSDIRERTFPYVGSSFNESTPVVPKWNDGTGANYALGNIGFVSNRHYRPFLYRPGEMLIGFGDIICDVDVGNPLHGDFNGDGIVNEGDENMLRANIGRRVGIDPLAVPLDVNGDGEIGLARDRDRDGFIATSERIYDDGWTLVHSTGDWLDLNGDGRNDLDADGSGQFDALE